MLYSSLLFGSQRDVVLSREAATGQPVVNVPCIIRYHAGGRFDWGCSSHATFELALNILHWWVPPVHDPSGTIGIGGTSISRRVWSAHRDFAVDFLLRVPYEGGVLAVRAAHPWLMERILFVGGPNNVDKGSSGRSRSRNVRRTA